MLQKFSFGHHSFRPVYYSLTGLACLLIGMGSRCEASHKGASPAILSAMADSLPYDLAHPSRKIVLEDPALVEISGLGFTNTPGIISAIADEKGEVFFLNINDNGSITERIPFKEKGDFEGIEMVGDTIYAMQSNAKLFEIINWKNGQTPVVNIYGDMLPDNHDIEGLTYDPKNHRLLFACKEDPEANTIRNVWGIDLTTKKLSDKPVYSLNPDQVDQIIALNDDDKERHFSTSGIAIHPQSGDIYLLSSALKRMAVLDGKTGTLKMAFRLDRKILVQPEGIAFDNDGNLFISSEGKKEQGYILRFDNRKPPVKK